MEYCFKPSALKDLKKLPSAIRNRIISKLDFFVKTKEPLRFAEKLKDKELGEFRFRIGDYRVVFDYDFKRQAIIILAIGHRKDIYN